MSGTPIPGLVSIVVASYNHARFLDRRMESLLAQTYKDVEILVIDDRSPDHSVEVLQKYATHPKVRLILRQENGGWVAVSNQGIELAKGEFVIFANCDDACEPEMVERLHASLAATPSAGVAFCRSVLIDERGRELGDDYSIRESAFRYRCQSDTVLRGVEMLRFLMDSCVIPNLSAALIRRECFDAVGLLSAEYRVCCDWDLFLRIFSRYDACYISAPLNHFRQHETTIRSRTNARTLYDEYLRLLLPHVRRLQAGPIGRFRARRQIMSLWALHLVAPSPDGFRDFFHHLNIVRRLDPAALLSLPAALMRRVVEVAGKVVNGRVPTGA